MDLRACRPEDSRVTLASQIIQRARMFNTLSTTGWYGYILTEPHIDGTMKSFVFVQYCINLG